MYIDNSARKKEISENDKKKGFSSRGFALTEALKQKIRILWNDSTVIEDSFVPLHGVMIRYIFRNS